MRRGSEIYVYTSAREAAGVKQIALHDWLTFFLQRDSRKKRGCRLMPLPLEMTWTKGERDDNMQMSRSSTDCIGGNLL